MRVPTSQIYHNHHINIPHLIKIWQEKKKKNPKLSLKKEISTHMKIKSNNRKPKHNSLIKHELIFKS